nr:EOG090X0BIL [Triops cancriformis]
MLYDDLDPQEKTLGDAAKPALPSWASGMKMFQSHLQLKKAGTTQPKREAIRKQVVVKKENEPVPSGSSPAFTKIVSTPFVVKEEPRFIPSATKSPFCAAPEYEWNIDGEYDPMVPNDYESIMKERRDKRNEFERSERRNRSKDVKETKSRVRTASAGTGFSKRPASDEEEEVAIKRPGMGAAIAPPPSLQEPSSSGGQSVAAKIMAKYGFRVKSFVILLRRKDKTSFRKDKGWNMVGPGEVDDDLEPEVKEECQTKYGDVVQVILYEMPGAAPDEAVRIFVEFKRMESAIKAVVDINGRFFGGRQVKAGFYDLAKLKNLDLAS